MSLCLMTQRRRLDEFLVEQAAEAGAEFRDGVRVEVEIGTASFASTASASDVDTLSAPTAPTDVTAKTLGLGGAIVNGVALEGNVPYDALAGGRLARAPRARARQYVPGGYGWIFPKGDHVNVGVGGWGDRRPAAPRAPARPLRALRPRARRSSRKFAGTGCRCAVPARRSARGRALLVGDAAGVLDPVSGDGMYEACVTATACRRDMSSPTRSTTSQARFAASSIALASAGWGAKKALDRFPRAVFTLHAAPGDVARAGAADARRSRPSGAGERCRSRA